MHADQALTRELKSYVRDSTRNIINDSNTFLKVRVEKRFRLRGKIGGGNLLIALGLFATLNYLGKLYKLLRGYRPKVNHKTRRDIFDETQAFTELISDTEKDGASNLGIPPKDYLTIYKALRHKLTHLIAPRIGYQIAAYVPPKNRRLQFSKAKKAIFDRNRPVFYNGSKCHVDRLSRDTERISDYLIKKIRKGMFKKKDMKLTLSWMKRQLKKIT